MIKRKKKSPKQKSKKVILSFILILICIGILYKIIDFLFFQEMDYSNPLTPLYILLGVVTSVIICLFAIPSILIYYFTRDSTKVKLIIIAFTSLTLTIYLIALTVTFPTYIYPRKSIISIDEYGVISYNADAILWWFISLLLILCEAIVAAKLISDYFKRKYPEKTKGRRSITKRLIADELRDIER